MAWTFTHTYDSVTTDISEMLLTKDISFNINGSPVAQSIELTLANTAGWSPHAGAEINVERDGILIFRGWVNALERTDIGPVAGIENGQTYHLVVSDIYHWLRTTYVPTAGQKQDGYTYSTRELEQPVGLRDKPTGADPGKLNITPQNMLLWALNLIRAVENRKANPAMPLLSNNTTYITNPTTQIPDGNGGLTNFRFKHCPFVADGQDYFSMLDSICQLAGLMWRIRPDLKLETWDAQNPPTSTIELVDGDASSGRVHEVTGGTWAEVRTLAMNEDISRITNRIRVTYVPNPDNGKRKALTVNNVASQEAWGIRERKIVTDYRTKQMAEAIARRALATDKNPNIRGSAQVPFDENLLPGRRIWVHRTAHPESSSYWRRRAYISSVRLVFEAGYDGPLWCQLELDHNIYQPPTFSPFIPPVDVATIPGTDTPGESTVGAPSPDEGAMLPKDGTAYMVPVWLPNYILTGDYNTVNARIKRTIGFSDPSGYAPEYWNWRAFTGSDTSIELYKGAPFSGRDFKFHTEEVAYRIVFVVCPEEVTDPPLEAKLFLGVNNVYNDDRLATSMSLRQLNITPKYSIEDLTAGVVTSGGTIISDDPIYPGFNADFDDVAGYLWRNPNAYTQMTKSFGLSYGINRLSMPITFQKISSADPKWENYNGRYGAFLVARIESAVGDMLVGLGASTVRIGANSNNIFIGQTDPLMSGYENYSTGSFGLYGTNPYTIDLADPTILHGETADRTLNFNAGDSGTLDATLYSYAVVQTSGTTGWSGGGNGTAPTEETDGGGNTTDGIQSPDGSLRLKMAVGTIGQTAFELPYLAKPGTLKVWLFYGTVDFNRSPLPSILTYQRDDEAGIYKFDIYPSAKYGMQPKMSCYAEFEPIYD